MYREVGGYALTRRFCFISVSFLPDFLSVPFWKHPRSARMLLTQPSKRLRGEKDPRFPFINSSVSHSLFLPHWVLFLPSCPFPFRLSSFASVRIAMARFGFLSLALLSLQALISGSFAAVCSLFRNPRFMSYFNINCLANVVVLFSTRLGCCREFWRASRSTKVGCVGAGVFP